jgi:DnaA family protein
MHRIPSQLSLSLSLRDEATFENFYSAKNIEAVEALKNTIQGKGEHAIYLYGKRGQGCSHLLQASCHYAHQYQLRSAYLPLANLLSFTPEILAGLECMDVVCVDDLHSITGKVEWEEALFHFYNRVYDSGGKIIMAANDLPKALHLTLPDLISRLSWAVIFKLHSLTDEEKLLALIMRADRRGIYLSDEVAKYILTHCPRHMGTLFAALDALDKASLAAQRRLTIPFVKEVLEIGYLVK